MKQQYAEYPAEIEVYIVGDKTDVILRKDIQEVSKQDDETQPIYSVYECEEKQFRYPGILTKDEIEADIDTWWDYEPKTANISIEDRLKAIQDAQEAQDEVLAELLLNTLSE